LLSELLPELPWALFLTAGLFIIFFKRKASPTNRKPVFHKTKELRAGDVICSKNIEQMSDISFGLTIDPFEKRSLSPKKANKLSFTNDDKKRDSNEEKGIFESAKVDKKQDFPSNSDNFKLMKSKESAFTERNGFSNGFLAKVFNNTREKNPNSHGKKPMSKNKYVDLDDDIESVPTKIDNSDENTYGEFVVDVDTLDDGSILTFADIIKTRKELIKYYQDSTTDLTFDDSRLNQPDTPTTVTSFEEEFNEDMVAHTTPIISSKKNSFPTESHVDRSYRSSKNNDIAHLTLASF